MPSPTVDQLRAENEALANRVRDLAVVNAFATSLLSIRDGIDDLLWEVANDVVGHLGLEDCVIYLVDPARGALVQRAAHGPKNPAGREILAPLVLPLGRGIVGTVAVTGRAELVEDTLLDARYVPDDAVRRSELAVPIVVDGVVRGVIDSEHSQVGYFQPHHLALLTTIASMTASRLQLAELHQRLHDLNRTLEERVLRRTEQLRQAHARSAELLLNVLPPSIALRLENGESRIAERFEDVAVLFVDLVGFTELSARWSPEAVVELLERVFTTFDALCDPLGCEKVKTVGDAWMAVCGVPEPRADAVDRLARLALRAHDALDGLSAEVGRPLQVRMGLHVGPVVAGVIGRSKFAWDLWGDTVNVASRLQVYGPVGALHVTTGTAARLSASFETHDRGEIEVKGMGRLRTSLVRRERTPHG